jgi:hypothetical protein
MIPFQEFTPSFIGLSFLMGQYIAGGMSANPQISNTGLVVIINKSQVRIHLLIQKPITIKPKKFIKTVLGLTAVSHLHNGSQLGYHTSARSF